MAINLIHNFRRPILHILFFTSTQYRHTFLSPLFNQHRTKIRYYVSFFQRIGGWFRTGRGAAMSIHWRIMILVWLLDSGVTKVFSITFTWARNYEACAAVSALPIS